MKIWKYQLSLDDRQQIDVPKIYIPRCVGRDPEGDLCIWIEVDPKSPTHELEIYVHGTGHEIRGSLYVGTVHDPACVWHIYTGQRANKEDTKMP